MLSRAQEKRLAGLKRRKIRDAEGLFLAEGVRVVEDLLDSGIALDLAVVSSSLEDTERGAALAGALARQGELVRVDDRTLARLAGTESPQGVLVAARTPRHELAGLRVEGAAAVLVLDAVQDPGNFGTLVRTAEALGALCVAALPGTVDPWNPKAVRSAAGSSFRIPVVQTELAPLCEWLRERGFALYGADAAGEPVGDGAGLAQRGALVVGNEGAGLSDEVVAAADARLSVPIRGRAESLNVGVAAGILLYLLLRRR